MKNTYQSRHEKMLAGKGWSAMREILDEEMPVERRKRRFLWLFWLLLLAPAAAGLLPALLRKPEPPGPANPPEKQLRPPVAAAEIPQQPPLRQPAPAPITVPAARTAPVMPLPLKPPPGIQPPAAAALRADALLPLPPKYLPLESPALADLPPRAPAPPRKAEKSRNWTPGAYLGAHSLLSHSAAGFSAGVTLERRLADRWGIRSGLGYRLTRWGQPEQNLVRIDNTTYSALTGDESVLDTSFGQMNPVVEPTPVYVAVSATHHLEMPLEMYFQPLPEWRLLGGVTFQGLLKSNASGTAFASNSLSPLHYEKDNPDLRSELYENSRRFQSLLTAGIGWTPLPQLEVSLVWRNRLGDPARQSANELADLSNDPLADQMRARSKNPGQFNHLQMRAMWRF